MGISSFNDNRSGDGDLVNRRTKADHNLAQLFRCNGRYQVVAQAFI